MTVLIPAHKDEMRDRINMARRSMPMSARRFSITARKTSTHQRWLAPRIVRTICSLPHAMKRAEFMWATAQQERRGVPLDLPMLNKLRAHWDRIKVGLVEEKDKPFGIYEIVNGVPHWRRHLFADLVKRLGMAWPAYPDGALDQRRLNIEVHGRNAIQLSKTYERWGYWISKMRLNNNLPSVKDGRNRTLLGPYGTKTARNAPSNAKYVFGPAKWIRFPYPLRPAWAGTDT